MLNENQIGELLNRLTSGLKGAANSKRGDKEDLYESVKWSELYEDAKKHCEEIEVHACGEFPKELLGHTFPNETKPEMEYRKKSFQPITEPYWKKAIRSLNRIWSEQNFTIKWGESEDASQYFLKELPIYKNIISYFKQVVTTNKINDPNAVLAIDFDLPVKQLAEGEIVIDDTKPISPYPVIYCTEDVIFFESGSFCLAMSEENSEVEYGGKRVKAGYVLYLYDNENIYRIVQVGKKIDYVFEAALYYTHGLGYLPCWKLKGTPEETMDGELLYDSHFSPAIPHLNEAIIMHSTLKASISKIAYPIRTYYEQKCSAAGCNGTGMIYEHGKEAHKCSTCNGTGSVRFSPLSDYVMEAPGLTNDVKDLPFPAVAYVSPDSAILDFSKTTIKEWIQQAFLFLNIDAAPDGMKTGLGSDATATKSKIDREEQFVSMLDISNELFELLENFLDAAYQIRFLSESPISVNPPKTFELISANELIDEIATARTSGLPDSAMGELQYDYVVKRFSQQANIGRFTEIARYCDVLFSKDDISIQLNAKYYTAYELVLHQHIYTFITEKESESEGFIDKDLAEIKPILVEMAKAKAEELSSGNIDPVKIIADTAQTP